MPTTADILLRDFERYTGDGKPNEPVGKPAPIGDPTSGVHNPTKKDFRDAINSVVGAADDADAAAARANQAADSAILAIGQPIVVYAAGQSNMRSTVNQTGGDLSVNQNVMFWNSQTSGQVNGNGWVVATPGQNPFASQNNINNLAFQFAKQLQVRTGRRVYVILVAVGGMNIEAFISPSDLTANGWTRSGTDEALDEFGSAQVDLALSQIPGSPTKFDYFIWHQGEANRSEQVEVYAKKMNVMLSRWETRGRLTRTGTQIIAGEIIETATTAQTKERHASALKRMQINVASEAWPRFKVVPSFSLRSTSPSDELHFAGTDLDALGGRYVDAAFTAQVPDDYDPLTCDKSVNAGLNWLTSHAVSGTGAYFPTRHPFPLSSPPTTIENNAALGWAHVAPANTAVSLVTRKTMMVQNQRNVRATLQLRNDHATDSATFQFAAHTFNTSGVWIASVSAAAITIPANTTQVVTATIGRTGADVSLDANVRWFAPRFVFNGGGTGAALKFLFLDISIT